MTSKLLYAAESWTKVYKAFETINYTAYDYDSVKQSLLDYLKLNYPEDFNDYTESSTVIALIELFAYIAEQHAYRVDMTAHENLLSTAMRKQSILRLAKLVSYTAARNLPLRGLVKLTSISCSEDLVDSQGNSLANKAVRWGDPTNPLWREQFQLAINRVLTRPLGDPFKSIQVDDTVFQQYELQNLLESEADGTSFTNGTLKLNVTVNGQALPFELVPSDVDENGVFERSPNPKTYFTMLYSDDGYGDTSDMTGFMMFLKQGALKKLQYVFDAALPNRIIDVNQNDINDVDVWLQEVSEAGDILTEWEAVDSINGGNLVYNSTSTFKRYELETLENDRVRLIFGAGDFSAIPVGIFNIWVRSSNSGNATVSKSDIKNQTITIAYTSKQGKRESCTFTFSLVSALQNSAPAEDIEHIRAVAPAVYSTQGRMVNGEDYNSFMLQDPSILHLNAINRTFAGQPKYLEWNDASGMYQNVKLFGDDGRLYYDIVSTAVTTRISSRSLIDTIIEPALADPGMYNLMIYSFYKSPFPLNAAYVRPRTTLIEDATLIVNGGPLQEKTLLQGALDRHWYGEADYLVYLGPDLTEASSPRSYYGVVNFDTDHLIYDSNLKLVLKQGDGSFLPVDTPGGISGTQETITRQRKFGIRFNAQRAFQSQLLIGSTTDYPLTNELTSDDINQQLAIPEVLTVEIIDEEGTFTVYGSKRGFYSVGTVGEAYDNGNISFMINMPSGSSDQRYYVGDAWIINITLNTTSSLLEPVISRKNLAGTFELIDEAVLPENVEQLPFDPLDEIASWCMLVERVDTIDGAVDFWRVTKRNFRLTVESPTTKFWYNNTTRLVDSETKLPVYDKIKLLKSNLTASGTPLGTDQEYFVFNDVRYKGGDVNINALQVTPSNVLRDFAPGDGGALSSLQFLQFIGSSSYVYFKEDPTSGNLLPIQKTAYIEALEFEDNAAGAYIRKLGRDNLDFSWMHYAPNENLIDPTTSNINDMFILTRGYYSLMKDYLNGVLAVEPQAPTPFELRTSYRHLLNSKMISDTVVLHPAKIKLLFGDKAVPELRAKVKIIKSKASKLTDDQIRIKTLGLIEQYFAIQDWPFGKTFYATELLAVIHKALALDISSVVLVPEFPANYFGDLLSVQAAGDEIMMPAVELKDIMIIGSLDRNTLRQK